MNHCGKCGVPVDAAETYEFAGESLCEDSYIERRAKPVTCDPWAVCSARNTSGKPQQLTDMQERILEVPFRCCGQDRIDDNGIFRAGSEWRQGKIREYPKPQ